MAVDFTPSFDGHDAQAKIGIITSANVVGNAVEIEGFIYAADFPETAQLIKDLKNVLGFSFEAQRLSILDPGADVLTITDLAFTGAAILRKDKAAYTTTSLAAKANPGELNMTARRTEGDARRSAEAFWRPPCQDRSRRSACRSAATTAVDVAALVKKELEAQAEVQRLAAAQAEAMKKAVDEAVAAATKPLIDAVAAAETKVKDIEAARKLEAGAPERKTISPMVTSLLSKAALSMPEGDAKLEASAVDAALAKSNLTVVQKIQLKNELSRAGKL